MSPETAHLIFFSVGIPMLVVWLLGVRFAFSRLRRPSAREDALRLDEEPLSGEPLTSGETVVDGDAEAVSKKLAELILAQSGPSGTFAPRIRERTAQRITVHFASGRKGDEKPPLYTLDVTLAPEGGRLRVRYELRARRLLTIFRALAWIVCFLYGGLFVIGVPVAIWLLVLRSEDAALRMQTIQIVQMVHGVWPPFLLGFVWGRIRRALDRNLEALFANLEHLQ